MAAKDGKLLYNGPNSYQKLTGGKPAMEKAGNSMPSQPKMSGSLPPIGKAKLGSHMVPKKG